PRRNGKISGADPQNHSPLIAFAARPRPRMTALEGSPQETPQRAIPIGRDERRTAAVAWGAHALHDGYTDLIYVLLPVWQKAIGTYNFSGDVGKMTLPAAAALLLVLLPWRPVLALLGAIGMLAGIAIFLLTPTLYAQALPESASHKQSRAAPAARRRFAFPLL